MLHRQRVSRSSPRTAGRPAARNRFSASPTEQDTDVCDFRQDGWSGRWSSCRELPLPEDEIPEKTIHKHTFLQHTVQTLAQGIDGATARFADFVSLFAALLGEEKVIPSSPNVLKNGRQHPVPATLKLTIGNGSRGGQELQGAKE
ncbi:hypothetical protein ZHAS_00009752 [Anopheles sinensis]|uniref:Uncharacterized protein n=1 Tax=Anopheles sinensis TaxID=74873 RepID=A0A084VVU9_ANOSI|nr:hypothetical protein ZHAS_00009752 [Anopheles sinensis]